MHNDPTVVSLNYDLFCIFCILDAFTFRIVSKSKTHNQMYFSYMKSYT